MKHIALLTIFAMALIAGGCRNSRLPVRPAKAITEKAPHDTDDPAIWVHPEDPERSLVFGTDKETDGAIFAYDLDGNILEKYTLRDIQRPNNVDVEYGLRLNDSLQTDILVFTERERQQIRVFSVPDMQPLDGGGFPVFEDEANPEFRFPMGVAVYKSPENGEISVVVGRKTGPRKGYLYQYALRASDGVLRPELLRKFGDFSGQKEIEAIAVDDELGYVYYSDEGVCIRKYHAEPEKGNLEITCFGGEYFKEDIEGIALAAYPDGSGYLLVSNQQAGEFNVFDRRTNEFLRAVNLGTVETDGCEAVTAPLGNKFPNGLFVAMNDDRTFHFFDLKKVLE